MDTMDYFIDWLTASYAAMMPYCMMFILCTVIIRAVLSALNGRIEV